MGVAREAEARAGVPFFASTPIDTKAERASVITVGVAVALSVAAIAYVLCTTSSKYRSTRLPDDSASSRSSAVARVATYVLSWLGPAPEPSTCLSTRRYA